MRDDGKEVVDVALATTLIAFDGEVDGVGDAGGMGVMAGDGAADCFEFVDDHVGLVDAAEVGDDFIVEGGGIVTGEEGSAFCEFLDVLPGAHFGDPELLDHDVIGGDGGAETVADGEEWFEEGFDEGADPTICRGHGSEFGGRRTSVPFGAHFRGGGWRWLRAWK